MNKAQAWSVSQVLDIMDEMDTLLRDVTIYLYSLDYIPVETSKVIEEKFTDVIESVRKLIKEPPPIKKPSEEEEDNESPWGW